MIRALFSMMIATSILFLTPSVAEQTPGATLSMYGEIASAKDPEEAARIFMKLVSIGVSQVVADALPKSLSAVANSSAFTANKNITGWEQYALAGLNLEWNWATPGLLPMSQYVANVRTASTGPVPAGEVKAKGVDISIGIGIRF